MIKQQEMSPPEVSHEGFSKMSSYIPPIPHDWLPSCITSNWWGLSSIELKVRIVALWNRMVGLGWLVGQVVWLGRGTNMS